MWKTLEFVTNLLSITRRRSRHNSIKQKLMEMYAFMQLQDFIVFHNCNYEVENDGVSRFLHNISKTCLDESLRQKKNKF